jgi:Tfp pilus assembly protein PilF
LQLGLAYLERDDLVAAQRWLSAAKHLDPSDRRIDLGLQQVGLRKASGRRRQRAA